MQYHCLAVLGLATEELTLLTTAESRARDGSDIANPSLVSEGSVTPDEDSR